MCRWLVNVMLAAASTYKRPRGCGKPIEKRSCWHKGISSMKILIVDDEPKIAEELKKLLEKEGCLADIASNGEMALDLLKTKSYDLAIFDYSIPPPTGLELVKYVKANGLKTRTIMLSGFYANFLLAHTIGADEYLSKPFDNAEIIRIVKKYKNNKS
jgi:YesN/AraC family two-component response regulator